MTGRVGNETPGPEDLELDEERREEIILEVSRLKEEKLRAVEEEDYEQAAVLKRRIKVLEDSLGQTVHYESRKVDPTAQQHEESPSPSKVRPKPLSQKEHGEDLWQMPPKELKLVEDERIFIERSKLAMRQKGVTDDTVQGVPAWAYKDALKEGPKGVRTDRPPELSYVYNGHIEDEKWEENANFQASIVVQVPVDVAFDYVLARSEPQEHQLQVGPGAFISHHVSGVAQLTELLGEVLENEMVCFKITMVKPRVPGKVKLEAAQAVRSKDVFRKQPFYSFKSLWKLQTYPAGGTRVTRVVKEFKQFELFDFDALDSVSRSIEVENEEIRRSWTSALRVPPSKAVAKAGYPGGITQMDVGKEMYSASFLLDVPRNEVFQALVTQELLMEYHNDLCADSFVYLDEMRFLLRQVNGMVLFVTSRAQAEIGSWTTMTVGHRAQSREAAMEVTSEQQVLAKPAYRVVDEWHIRDDNGKTLVRRSMRDFTQLEDDIPDLPAALTEAADEENRKLIKAFERRKKKEAASASSAASARAYAMSVRANYAMRQMPAILDHAAKNHVLEVREMLEVKGADPNYIHVRKDSWAISDTRLEFYEEITPLVVAAEYGACEVIKVLFNHPQIDVNLCCCAFNDSEIYNYYTAYDVTIAKKHPHAAALLRARGVLPASSEHVFKPPFDVVHGRPLREDLNHTYDDEDFAEGEMPRWDTVAQGDPDLALELQKVADALSTSKEQSLKNRNKIFKALVMDWHPDRAKKGHALSTKVFQWLQVVRPWYLEEKEQAVGDLPPLMQSTDQDFGPAPGEAKEYMHPSGNLFSVW